ncbi:PSD1 and planctomycete cytochrome C domain-containing protein [Humisphaera borealis]|uniref:PSD1 and planctomycete cytochrome C domain-containing protein n=1 Tax=Humisphaera borealis TaxID=2807512 RepID=UPI0019D0238F|nr:PSD1 and planctomycete cytochrome C domain-containing protein [Humisphaera borealis]
MTQDVRAILLVLAAIAAASIATRAGAVPVSPADRAFFENRVRPVLVKHCYECHSAGAKKVGGKLLLDTPEGMRKGGESGALLEAGNPDKSLLIHALRYDGTEMPPSKPLPAAVVNDFADWVKRGAPDPRGVVPAATTRSGEAEKGEVFWSLRPVSSPVPPDVQDNAWPRDPIDRFVMARLESSGLKPAKDANPQALVRRIYIDLIGLPPTSDQFSRFVTDYQRDSGKAVERLVDELLASPHFGERWGRHWLDVARFGESNGNDGLGRNPTFPHAWRYRDYVIAAFNSDTPYDRFLTEQIAGDLLPADSDVQRDRNRIATGFLALGSKPAKAMNANFDMDVVADQIDVIGRGIMGLSVACARCHDHKFDPIPTRDYYALAGFFTSTETLWGIAGNEALTAPATDLHVLKTPAVVPPPKEFVETVVTLESNTGKPKAIPKPKWAPGTPLAMGVRDRPKPADCKINIKGESNKLGESVPRGFLSAVEGDRPSAAIDASQSGRVQLAQWLTRGDHPLTARVMVNRVWLHLFGEGLVRTPDDFGLYGEAPTHPELLDHLAGRFVRDGWSVKRLVRGIVLSRTYQLSCEADAATVRADAQNLLLARHKRRRLDAESLRDAMLSVSGQLETKPAEGSLVRHRDILINLAGSLHQPSVHRSVYLCYLRSSPPPELAAFDLPEFTSVTGQRDVSTIPSQALHLYNSPFVIEQAAAFARLLSGESADARGRAKLAWQRAFHRDPGAEELEQAVRFVEMTATGPATPSNGQVSEQKAWAALCQVLLAANEFRYVD